MEESREIQRGKVLSCCPGVSNLSSCGECHISETTKEQFQSNNYKTLNSATTSELERWPCTLVKIVAWAAV